MFRPDPEQTLFGQIPVRLIVSIILIVALVLTIMLVLGIEREKNVVEGLVKVQALSQEERFAFLKSREDLILMTLALFLISGIGISVIVTYQSYHATRKTLEQVKSLARSILFSLPTGVLTINRSGSITALNPFAAGILRLHADEVLGKSFLSVFPDGNPIRETLKPAFERGIHAKDQDILYPALPGSALTIRLSTSELQDDDQSSTGVVMLLQDISELIHLEQQLRRSDKLSALHTLSAGVAHEIRNPLSALDLNLHLLDQEIRDRKVSCEEIEHYLRVLEVEIERLKGILENFTRFTKPSALRLQEVRLCEVLGQMIRLLEFEAKEKGIRLESRFPDHPVQIMGDGTQLSQAFLNILINALQAIPREGTVTVEVQMAGDAEPAAEILIRDTGTGIPASEVPRLFEPFYTTKKEGSGLGLPIAYRIVQDHRGTIQIESAPGHGTTVRVLIPCQLDDEVVQEERG